MISKPRKPLYFRSRSEADRGRRRKSSRWRSRLIATRCQDSRPARRDVGMAECQDSSQLRVTYITNDCGPGRAEPRERERERERKGARAHGSVGGPMLRASHRLSSRRYADPAPRLPYFNATVIGSPPATGILKAPSSSSSSILERIS